MISQQLKGYFGLPSWTDSGWQSFNPGQAGLAGYSQLFNCIEGNTSFYALPNPQTVMKWHQQTPKGFRFCFKMSRSVTHQSGLVHCDEGLKHFFRCFEPLMPKLGPVLIQLPAQFSPEHLPRLVQFLPKLSQHFYYALEVRHPEFFAGGESERQLNRVLRQYGIEQMGFDTRFIFSKVPNENLTLQQQAALQEAQGKKPRVPLRLSGVGPWPVMRIIGPVAPKWTPLFVDQWHRQLKRWHQQNKRPFLFIHMANIGLSAQLAHTLLNQWQPSLAWPSTVEQGGLF